MSDINPAVSIICTNYNKGEWIREAIESLLAQKTNFDFEIILIDDKSTDESPDILRKYAEKFPDKIRLFENEKNLGITRTWKKICLEARGKYIARCDGDDFWTDENKLQKQYDLLESTDDSGWCNTDFDIANEDGVVSVEGGFESGAIPLADNFAKMLATRGFTMSSTWLVETDLMLEANKNVPDDAVDDTFNIQLELFKKTKLSYIPDSTTIYRVNDGSDSKPIDIDKITSRNNRLLETQSSYVEELDLVGAKDSLRELLEYSNTYINMFRDVEIQLKGARVEIESKNNDIQKISEEFRAAKEESRSREESLSNDIENLKRRIFEIEASRSYKIGRILSKIYRKLKVW